MARTISSGLARERDRLRTQTYGNRESTDWRLRAATGPRDDGKSFGHPSPPPARKTVIDTVTVWSEGTGSDFLIAVKWKPVAAARGALWARWSILNSFFYFLLISDTIAYRVTRTSGETTLYSRLVYKSRWWWWWTAFFIFAKTPIYESHQVINDLYCVYRSVVDHCGS